MCKHFALEMCSSSFIRQQILHGADTYRSLNKHFVLFPNRLTKRNTAKEVGTWPQCSPLVKNICSFPHGSILWLECKFPVLWPGTNKCKAEGERLGFSLGGNKRLSCHLLSCWALCKHPEVSLPLPGEDRLLLHTPRVPTMAFSALQQLWKECLHMDTHHNILTVLSPSSQKQYA